MGALNAVGKRGVEAVVIGEDDVPAFCESLGQDGGGRAGGIKLEEVGGTAVDGGGVVGVEGDE